MLIWGGKYLTEVIEDQHGLEVSANTVNRAKNEIFTKKEEDDYQEWLQDCTNKAMKYLLNQLKK
ncbi:hypothetical protein [Vibrio breoganii]|uniref:hypothetical protein n=1 Tax=Vibrio breoganii TaxID=553239 RepID=UPI00031B438D|nr:hypothetical protein [Vibrio breoganii]OEF87666.1 hypothetical protein B003_14805 [Vibrio breoganii 1C10]